ncbi:alpha/beta hydrolase [Thiogranum longum]
MLELIEVKPKGEVKRSVIWLHGLGADGYDFEPMIEAWGLADELGVRFVLPHAPRRPVTVNGGMVMRAWYDIYDLDFAGGEDRRGLQEAEQHLLELIRREQQRGVESSNILLAGFSQGGAVALHTALRFQAQLAGVLVLSAYLPMAGVLDAEKRADPARLLIRMDHGDRDPVVPFTLAERSRQLIEAQGYRVEFHRYPMEHGLCPPQIQSLRNWLTEHLG